MSVQLISYFDIWQPGYDGAMVTAYVAGTTNLALIFADEALTQPLANPQELDSRTDVNNSSYGKFKQSIYTAQPYYLTINTGDDTGVKRPPITSLTGQDASPMNVTVAGAAIAHTLAQIVARIVYAENYGNIQLGGDIGSAATNTTTLTAAIGALGTAGVVVLPAGLIRCNAFSIPAGVVLEGQGESATTLQIISAAIGLTLTGDQAGLRNLSLNGNNLTPGSVGVYAVNRTSLLFENVSLQAFETGLICKGAQSPQWRNFSILNCTTGAQLHGDTDAGGTHLGGAFLGGAWDGGTIAQCATTGLELKYVDAIMAHLAFANLLFTQNIGTAIVIKGAQFLPFTNCQFSGNGLNFDISDDMTVLAPASQYQNKVAGIFVTSGLLSGGSVQATGNVQDVAFAHVKLLGVTFNLMATLSNNIILRDCFEDSGTLVTGSSSQLVRTFSDELFEVSGLTTGNVSTRACGMTIDSGGIAYFETKIVGIQRNGVNKAIYHAVCGAYRDPDTLAYLNQTADFTLGDVLTGTNSGATARVVADSDSGTFGTLSLKDVKGTFATGELITGSTTGSAAVNGTLADGAYHLDSVGLALLRTAYETDAAWDIQFVASPGEIAVNVQGNSSQTIDWTVQVNQVAG